MKRTGALVIAVFCTMLSLVATSASAATLTRKAVVLSAGAVPRELGSAGGHVEVKGRVMHAMSCQLKLLSDHSLAVLYSHNPKDCTTGDYSARVVVGANFSSETRKLSFELVATSQMSSFDRRFYVTIAGTPPPATRGASGTTTTTSVPPTTTSSSTTTTAPVIFFPPPAPAPSTTTTTVAPTTTTTTTTTTATTTTTTTTTTTVPTTTTSTTTTTAPTTTTTTVPTPPVVQVEFDNWSGWGIESGPYSAVQSTFTVPYLTTDEACGEEDSTWAGIDGIDNTSLIQAGIGETPYDPGTGQCSSTEFWTYPWWEVLPGLETPIAYWNSGQLSGESALVYAGDQVTVTIWLTSGSTWAIELTDDTTGGVYYTTTTSYSGPQESSEWVQEAVTNETECGGQCQLAPFCTMVSGSCLEEVSFSNLGYAGPLNQYDEITMEQDGAVVATPSGIQDGAFNVVYTGVYAAPALGVQVKPLKGVAFTGHVLFPSANG